MKRRWEAMTSSTRSRRLSKASATRPTSSAGASTVAARLGPCCPSVRRSPRGSMASISAAMRLSGPRVRRTDRKATATAKASPSPLAQATAERRLSTVRSRLVVVAATSRVPRGSPPRTSGTVNARTSPPSGPGTVHHRPSVAASRSSRRPTAPRSRPPLVERTSSPEVRTAMTSSSAWACTDSHRRASAASCAESVTRPAGPSRNEVAAELSRRSREAPRSSRISRAATPATTSTVAATRRAAMAVSRVGRLIGPPAGLSGSVRHPARLPAPWSSVVGGQGSRRPLPFLSAGAQSTWLSTFSTCPGPTVADVVVATGGRDRGGGRRPGRRGRPGGGGGRRRRSRGRRRSRRCSAGLRRRGRRGRCRLIVRRRGVRHPEGDGDRGRERLLPAGAGQHAEEEQDRCAEHRRGGLHGPTLTAPVRRSPRSADPRPEQRSGSPAPAPCRSTPGRACGAGRRRRPPPRWTRGRS